MEKSFNVAVGSAGQDDECGDAAEGKQCWLVRSTRWHRTTAAMPLRERQ